MAVVAGIDPKVIAAQHTLHPGPGLRVVAGNHRGSKLLLGDFRGQVGARQYPDMRKAGLLIEDLAHELEALLLNSLGGTDQNLLRPEPGPRLAYYLTKCLGGNRYQHQLGILQYRLHIAAGTHHWIDS